MNQIQKPKSNEITDGWDPTPRVTPVELELKPHVPPGHKELAAGHLALNAGYDHMLPPTSPN